MLLDRNELQNDLDRPSRSGAPIVGALPSALVWCEQAVSQFRAWLEQRGLGDYDIFHCSYHDLYDIDDHLASLGDAVTWEPHSATTAAGEPMVLMTYNQHGARLWPGGFLRIDAFEAVIGRWYWVESNNAATALWLIAANTPAHYHRLHRRVEELRHAHSAAVWQVVRGAVHQDGERTPRLPQDPDQLLLLPQIRDRLEIDLIRFFEPRVGSLYAAMGVPYRRGVLLHGPPGNGKTSMIRYVGGALPKVPAMILRPAAGFDSDDLTEVFKRWRQQAPGILVIEDLNWLLEAVDVSTFLNMIDGIDSDDTGGLLLIATTNHPHKLDAAINNRPGRFDVVLEVPSPDRPLRTEFFRRKLPEIEPSLHEELAHATEGLSFAHLQEVLRLSGFLAIHCNRRERDAQDLLRAAEMVAAAHHDAQRGFPPKAEAPFGLAAWRGRAKA